MSTILPDTEHLLESTAPAAETPIRRPVRMLPAHLINRIAAGEVVERPASVVKELVENALDAGATKIEIVASAAGRTLRISDNGCGLHEEDARLAFYNHATSKIQAEEDLNRIQTLGFRGEALASIASISKLTCLTRTADAGTGLKIVFDPNSETPTEPIITPTGCAPGTVMEVAELFYNTPARLKFLKRPTTEFGHIDEIVETLALSHPGVRFRLVSNERQMLQTSGNGNLKQVIHDVFRLDRDPVELVEVKFSDPDAGYAIHGYTSSPGVMKNSRRWLVTFTNGRTVKCHLLNKAIETAYESLLPQGRYPLCVLHLTLPIDELDVNVHPTKKEVRYANNKTVFSFVQVAIKKALEQFGYVGQHFAPFTKAQPNLAPDPLVASNVSPLSADRANLQPLWAPANRPAQSSDAEVQVSPTRWSYRESEPATAQSRMSIQDAMHLQAPFMMPAGQPSGDSIGMDNAVSVPETMTPDVPHYKVLGQLFNTYILLETSQGLMVVDQHIASERELFEKISLRMLSDTPPVQQCLGTASIPLSPLQLDLLNRHPEVFQKLGFTYQLDTAGASVQLTGIPLIYQDRAPNQQPQRLFEDLLQQLEATGDAQLELDHHVSHLIATLACHTAVRAGDPLTHSDMETVIQGWLTSKLPWTCPHGRPIAHTINKDELNRFFHRPSLPVNSI